MTFNQKKFKKWADYSPKNYLHKFYLLTAEIYRVKGQKDLAIEYYDWAVERAKINDYINEEALGQELTAKFYLKQQKNAIAKAYMREAIYCYTRWGATAKARDLETKYPELITRTIPISAQEILASKFELDKSAGVNSASLDLATVTKAAQAISSEIAFDQLLMKLIEIAIENAGAQSGILILETDGELLIEASLINSQPITSQCGKITKRSVASSLRVFKSCLTTGCIRKSRKIGIYGKVGGKGSFCSTL